MLLMPWWLYALFAYVVALLFASCIGTQSGSFLLKSDSREVIFRKPWWKRIGPLGGIPVFLAFPIGFPFLMPTDHSAASLGPYLMLGAMCYSVFLGVAWLAVALSAPEELILDKQTRTYSYKRGWLGKLTLGSFDEFSGLNYKLFTEGRRCWTRINLKGQKEKYIGIGQFDNESNAKQQIDQLASELGLPTIPKHWNV